MSHGKRTEAQKTRTLWWIARQRVLLNSQIGLVTEQMTSLRGHSSDGRATPSLPVPYYDPIEHYDLVKNKWFGLRLPTRPEPQSDACTKKMLAYKTCQEA